MKNALFLIGKRWLRRKTIRDEDMTKTDLARCLTLLDLTALGIGSTLGAGAYVIAGQVAKRDAGPAVVISFLIAAVASVLAGLCYAEFGARVPKAGSAYVYTYVTVGELMAFVIGWNLILEYVIGAASVARTASGYFDDLIGDKLVPWFNETLPMNVDTLAPYADLFALGITLVLTLVLAIGVKESAMFTKVFTLLNLLILSYVIIAGAFKDDPTNWRLPAEEVPKVEINDCQNGPSVGCGEGGFAPYGFGGIMKGAATCFFAFVGFDAIATTGEEAHNPQRSIPLATVISLSIVFAMYFAISLTITMMAPYFDLDMQAPFATIFENVGWTASKYIVAAGAICALTTSLLGSMLPMPRVILAMARDGLIFKPLAYIHPTLKTPIVATLVSGALAAVMAALFNVDALVEMMSIGTLLAYTLVSASVMLLRYDAKDECKHQLQWSSKTSNPLRAFEDGCIRKGVTFTDSPPHIQKTNFRLFRILFAPSSPCPTPFTSELVKWLTATLIASLTGIAAMLKFASKQLFAQTSWWAMFLLAFFTVIFLVSVLAIGRQPQSAKKLSFKVPWIPFFPACSIFFNVYLMINLEPLTWVRFLIWMAIGFAIYFGYGMWHSSEEKRKRSKNGLSLCAEFELGEHPSKDTLLSEKNSESCITFNGSTGENRLEDVAEDILKDDDPDQGIGFAVHRRDSKHRDSSSC